MPLITFLTVSWLSIPRVNFSAVGVDFIFLCFIFEDLSAGIGVFVIGVDFI